MQDHVRKLWMLKSFTASAEKCQKNKEQIVLGLIKLAYYTISLGEQYW